ncbi:hypothetical protein NA57DRAFT_62624 [Rhizodiscina lignyota]|uniref:alpha-glucosidase n=1 Tax=Rhizodiscina lignyota TaxID=1504668 RepID=A0A9P4IQA2_9PEZI|nr:hypothetical protein NA57DRAFT_62624 [Rhizodiscina lignyota]
MPQHEFVPKSWELDDKTSNFSSGSLSLSSTENGSQCTFNFQVIEDNIFRATFTTKDHPLPPHPSASKLKPQSAPTLDYGNVVPGPKQTFKTANVVAQVEWTHTPIVSLSLNGSNTPIHQDLPFRSYTVDGDGVAHYTAYNRTALHVGLGEKAAPMDLSGRAFRISSTDCFGYNAYKSDPLYKVIPFLITATPEGCVAMFSTSHSRGFYSIGSEMDGLWGHYKVYRQDHGGLEQYFIVGKTIQDVVRSYADLVGYPRLVPRWAFGYIAGGMKYSMLDEPPAHKALLEFAGKLKEYDIPCSGFQMSSGYTVAETEPKTRNVFTWNHHRFPDPKAFVDAYHAHGIRLIANVKPYVLANHPEYKKLAAANAFFTDPRTKSTAVTRLWSAGGGESGEGGHIDFTSSAGFKWWYDGIQSLAQLGIDVPWNDNNEYTIPNDDWQCALDEPSIQSNKIALLKQGIDSNKVGLWGRALHTELMGKSSYDALTDLDPNRRPFVLTRSATAGTMRYCASSWSGDNVTSWASFKGGNALALNAGMSLLQCYGHDTGGFEGPQPSPALLLRWIQTACHTSRFAINCFKTSNEDNKVGDVIEPWMYPEITPLVKKAVKRRYEIIPYTYNLALRSHLYAEPPQRWVGWGYESDPEVWSEGLKSGETQFWFGDTLMIGGVYEENIDSTRLYLPKKGEDDPGYLNLNSPYQHIKAGQWTTVESKWKDSIPTIAKCGGAIPVGKDVQVLSTGEPENPANLPADDYRGVEIFPPMSRTSREYSATWYEDDGISAEPDIAEFTIRYACIAEGVVGVAFGAHIKKWKPLWKELHIILPSRDDRTLVHLDAAERGVEHVKTDDKGRSVYKITFDTVTQ